MSIKENLSSDRFFLKISRLIKISLMMKELETKIYYRNYNFISS